MPDYGGRRAEENEWLLETASCRDLPQNNYGAQMLERTLPSQQQPQPQHQHQHLSGGRKVTGGIMRLANYRGWTVNVRAPKWKDNQLWINSEDLLAAKFIADAAYHFTGRTPFHFHHFIPHYLPLRLSTGEELTTRKKCSAYVAKIAKDPALVGQRRDFKERAQKLILEMVKTPEVVQFLNSMRAWQPLPEVSTEDNEDENGTAMEFDPQAIETSASMVAVNFSQCGRLFPVVEDTRFVIPDDGGVENGTPMEVDSLSVEAIQAITPTGTVEFASLFQIHSTISNFPMDVDFSTTFVPGYEIYIYESENFLTSACERLGIWYPHFREKEADLVPENCRELLASLEKGEEEIWESLEPLDLELWRPLPTFSPYSPLLAPSLPESRWQSRGTTSGADAAHEALRPPARPFLCQNRWRP